MSKNQQPASTDTNNTPASGEQAADAGVSLSQGGGGDPLASAPGAPPAAESAPAENPTDRRKKSSGFSGTDQRKNVVDRRTGLNRRVLDMGSPTGLERRRGPGRRRSDDRRSAEEGEMSDEQFEFVMAIDTYKRLNNRPFPTWTEVLEVIKQLGYRKVAASTIKLPNDNGRATQS